MARRRKTPRASAIAILLALAGCATAPPPAPAYDDDVISAWSAALSPQKTGSLNMLFAQLAALQAGRSSRLRILQLGDSHTAADFLSGTLRDSLRNRFGNAGIGLRAAGLPYWGVRQNEMSITEAGHWVYENSLRAPAAGPYGLTGFTAVAQTPGASLTLNVTDPRGFDEGFVEFARTPHGGALDILIDGKLVRHISTAGPADELGHIPFRAPIAGARQLRLIARTPGIKLIGWDTERDEPGILLDDFGVVGASAAVTAAWNPALTRRQLALLRPALIILAYGTNEAADKDFDAGQYAAQYAQLLAHLRAWSPTSSILIIAPTDGAHHPPGCATPDCPWVPLPALPQVRRIQAREALIYHAAIWDASAPERQSGGITQWVRGTPPLARPDHVHFTAAGYRIIAQSLFTWLMHEYDLHESAPPRPGALG